MVKLNYQGVCIGCNYGKFKLATIVRENEDGKEQRFVEIRCKHKEACERAYRMGRQVND